MRREWQGKERTVDPQLIPKYEWQKVQIGWIGICPCCEMPFETNTSRSVYCRSKECLTLQTRNRKRKQRAKENLG